MSYCHVCGALLDEPPWGESGLDATYNICPCCGCEFGYEDFQVSGVLRHREQWLRDGANWFSPKMRPADWDLEQQLNCLPPEPPPGVRRDMVDPP